MMIKKMKLYFDDVDDDYDDDYDGRHYDDYY